MVWHGVISSAEVRGSTAVLRLHQSRAANSIYVASVIDYLFCLLRCRGRCTTVQNLIHRCGVMSRGCLIQVPRYEQTRVFTARLLLSPCLFCIAHGMFIHPNQHPKPHNNNNNTNDDNNEDNNNNNNNDNKDPDSKDDNDNDNQ